MDWNKKEYWIVLSLLSVVAVYTFLLRYQKVETERIADFNAVPLEIGDWVGRDFTFGEDVLDVLKADRTFFRRYVNSSGTEVWLFIGYWADQKYGAQPHSPLHCLPGSGWNIVSNQHVRLHIGSNGNGAVQSQDVNYAVISNGEEREGMLFWYETRSGRLAEELSVKIDLARNALLRRPMDAAFIRMTAPMSETGAEEQLQTLRQFWQQIQPHVVTAMPFE